MAEINVLIKYVGPVVEDIRKPFHEIPRIFYPDSSYVDTPVFTEGYENEEGVGDGKGYGKSIYATNVDGWGSFPGLLPMASFTGKFAQFERAIFAAIKAEEDGEENKGIEFTIDGYEDEIYWNQIAANMVEQGFYIKVGDTEHGVDPDA